VTRIPDVPWQIAKEQLILRLRVMPNAQSDKIDGLIPTQEGEVFRARLNAPAREGRANVALEVLVARCFGVPKCNVTLVGGQKSRIKRVAISGDLKKLKLRAGKLLAEFQQSN